MNSDPTLLFHIFKVIYLKIFTENIMKKTFSMIFANKAYRPNAHLLDTLMHYNINIIYYYNIVIIITVVLI